jgi:hypothetical protein
MCVNTSGSSSVLFFTSPILPRSTASAKYHKDLFPWSSSYPKSPRVGFMRSTIRIFQIITIISSFELPSSRDMKNFQNWTSRLFRNLGHLPGMSVCSNSNVCFCACEQAGRSRINSHSSVPVVSHPPMSTPENQNLNCLIFMP